MLGKRIEYQPGEKVGKLIFVRDVDPVEYPNCGASIRHAEFECRCGRKFQCAVGNVKTGNTESCGECDFAKPTKKPPGEAVRFELFGNYRDGAKKRGHDFQLTYEQFKEFTTSLCHYCGAEPSSKYRWGEKARSSTGGIIYNGVDRVDNAVGYLIENCVACCGTCNNAKATMSASDFLDWVERVHEYQQPEDECRGSWILQVVVKSIVGGLVSYLKGLLKPHSASTPRPEQSPPPVSH